ncbi:hypothetical protein A2661_00255 [Candidatus Giovannonibacteria bacterium RIFCSPHIGHO2_01_FULL_45_24]|uniref:Uncharacterized protein n=1 Tax=Candidatus Giovannonibacteria bacterium RIFCSPLOWO2_01_FULL_46_32 TaxID=1798353 RepID=A0A1F5XHQ1_9BACT|nr:MAG: hypothetical protein A2661_00255 [Candidatus Giovannonibacteria bacterium RIFCSPHIGHO2_01_FULL_45_24]OGF87011.1 MAG: hypothetical protein A3B19_01095 [Candidatus Giovannonibacteria bacterium RIFCSPLOWO2_01_FULL_46_32]
MAGCDVDPYGIVGAQRKSEHCSDGTETAIGHNLPKSIKWECSCGKIIEEEINKPPDLPPAA